MPSRTAGPTGHPDQQHEQQQTTSPTAQHDGRTDDVPTYQYVCTACEQPLEAQQSFTDDPLTVCPRCEGRLRKVFSAVGVVFKGSGFYRNDSRDAKPKNGESKAKTDATSDGGTSDAKPGKSDGKQPAAAQASKPAGKDSGSSSGSSSSGGKSSGSSASSTAGSAA